MSIEVQLDQRKDKVRCQDWGYAITNCYADLVCLKCVDIGLVKNVISLADLMVLQEVNLDHYPVFFKIGTTTRENMT
ncbi:hypothetical protein V1478_015614 [Vespula squamosa]|uniref:Uncharacterized protein n=1 Tax=Vespula squamosa TaxID=30214 RepID=A0ABD2A1E4_VESSQ